MAPDREKIDRRVEAFRRSPSALDVTLDRRHFGVVRPRHVGAFRLLP